MEYGAIEITTGPDGNLWFTECRCTDGAWGTTNIGRITPTGLITEFPLPTGSAPWGITAGPDGNVWFGDLGRNSIVKITRAGVMTEFPIPTTRSYPVHITTGPDRDLWFTELFGNKIARLTADGVMVEYPLSNPNSQPEGIVTGPDGNLWFVEWAKRIAKVTIGPRYNTCLLYDPTKAARSGATLAIKLQLCDASGNNLSSPGMTRHATRVTQTSTSISGPVEDAGNANPDNDFRFDGALGTTGGYIFNLKTTGLMLGTYAVNFTVTGDSYVYAAVFQVK